MARNVALATVLAFLSLTGTATAGRLGSAPMAGECVIVRVFDEGPFLSGTRTTIVCHPTRRTHLYEDATDYQWSYVRLDGQLVAIPPDSRAGTWSP